MQNNKILSISMNKTEQTFGAVYLLLALGLLPVLFPFCALILFPNLNSAQVNFFYFLFQFLCIACILRNFLWRSLQALGNHPVRLATSVVLGLLGYTFLNSQISLFIVLLFPGFSNVNDGNIAAIATQNYSLMAAGTIFLVPVAEECLYRGVVFGNLLKRNALAAYLISTILFCAIHVLNYIGSYHPITLLLCAIQYIPAGVCLAWAYRRSDSIFAPILMHAIINAIGIFSVR